MAKPLLCRIGFHKWRQQVNDSGQRYNTCQRCGKYDDTQRPTTPFGA